MEFIGVLPAGGAMFCDHRYVSVVGVVALFVHVDVGDGCFPLYVVLSMLSFLSFASNSGFMTQQCNYHYWLLLETVLMKFR
jgi:hypothetical protein